MNWLMKNYVLITKILVAIGFMFALAWQTYGGAAVFPTIDHATFSDLPPIP